MQKSIFVRSFWILTVILLSTSVFASDWPTLRGPNNDGTAADGKFIPPAGAALAIAWKSAIGSGYSNIAVANGRVITLFTDKENDVAAAFDSASGKELWRYTIGPKYKGHDGSQDGPIATPVIADSIVYGFGAHGHLFALNLETGKPVWAVNAAEKHGAKAPVYGFSASPVVAGGVLVVEIGAESGKAIAGFDLKTGEQRWTAGEDKINYQSPVVLKSAGKEVVAAIGDTKLFLLDPASGKVLLEYPHAGDSAEVVVPLPIENDRILLPIGQENADLLKITSGADGKLAVEKVWSASIFKNTYAIPVYYKGYIYGYNGRILMCVDAANGSIKWRSREPGDGWLLIVDGNLVVQTKKGTVHVGPASPEGWKEIAQVGLFKGISWAHPVYASGGVFTRSFGELARLEWRTDKTAATAESITTDGSRFAKFISELGTASDKKTAVDQYFASVKQYPIVEWPDYIHFVYRGDAEDMGISGDMIGSLREEPMQHVEGTDLFYYSARLEPDAHILYRFHRNFDEQIADPKNANKILDRRGSPMSYVPMPGYNPPEFLKEAPASKKGKVEAREFTSTKRQGASAKLSIYVPANYASSKDKYPVVYLYDGAMAQKQGLLPNILDNLIGNEIQPLIAVMIDEMKTGEKPLEDQSEDIKVRSEMLAKEIVAWIDSNFRTLTDSKSRAVMGPGGESITAFYTAFHHHDTFGAVVAQTVFTAERSETGLGNFVPNSNEVPMRIYLDWGIYDSRAPLEGWDTRRDSKRFHSLFLERGYRPAGGEVHEGAGWPNWRNRADKWLAALFPSGS